MGNPDHAVKLLETGMAVAKRLSEYMNRQRALATTEEEAHCWDVMIRTIDELSSGKSILVSMDEAMMEAGGEHIECSECPNQDWCPFNEDEEEDWQCPPKPEKQIH